jgi:putative phage-type endonuclease
MKQILSDESIQGSPEWLEARKNFRNASETPDVMGCGFNTPNKLKRIKAGLETVFVNSAMKRGNDLEDQVREWAENELNQMFSPQVWENGKFRASLDGISFDQKVIVEIKVSDYTFESVKNDEIPRNYWLQIQHQLYCCPAETAYLIAYSPTSDEYIISKSICFDHERWEKIQTEWHKFEQMPIPEEEYIEIKDVRYQELDEEYASFKEEKDSIETKLKEIKAEMELIAEGKNIKGHFTKLKFSNKKGSVDYKKILKDNEIKIDEDKYRKPSTTVATVYINKL